MRLLADEERLRATRERNEKKGFIAAMAREKRGSFKPIDLLKDAGFRRTVQSCFKSSTRDGRNIAFASHTNPPEVGKYKPKNDIIWRKPKAAKMEREHSHLGSRRLTMKHE